MAEQSKPVAVVPTKTTPSMEALMTLPPSDTRDMLVMAPQLYMLAQTLKKPTHTTEEQLRMMLAAQSYGLDMRVANMLFYIVKDKVTPETPALFQLVAKKYPDATFEYVDEGEFWRTGQGGKQEKYTVRAVHGEVAIVRAGRKGKERFFKYTLDMLKATPNYQKGAATKWEKGNESMKDFPDDHLIKKCARYAFKRAFPDLEASQGFEEEYPEERALPELKKMAQAAAKLPPPKAKPEDIAIKDSGTAVTEHTEPCPVPATEDIPPPQSGPVRSRPTDSTKPKPKPQPKPKPKPKLEAEREVSPKPKPAPKPKPQPKPNPPTTPVSDGGELAAAFEEMESMIHDYHSNYSDGSQDIESYTRALIAKAISLTLPQAKRPKNLEELLPDNLDNLPLDQVKAVTAKIKVWETTRI